MSAIADFRLIETSKLSALRDNAEIKIEKKLFSKKTIDNYWNYLNANSKKLRDFEYSGYIFANLLSFLETKGIDLLKSKYDDIADGIVERRQHSAIILTYDHRQAYLHQLNPDSFSLEELIAFNKDFSEEDDPELAKAEIEGIKMIQEGLKELTADNQVVLLNVG